MATIFIESKRSTVFISRINCVGRQTIGIDANAERRIAMQKKNGKKKKKAISSSNRADQHGGPWLNAMARTIEFGAEISMSPEPIGCELIGRRCVALRCVSFRFHFRRLGLLALTNQPKKRQSTANRVARFFPLDATFHAKPSKTRYNSRNASQPHQSNRIKRQTIAKAFHW